MPPNLHILDHILSGRILANEDECVKIDEIDITALFQTITNAGERPFDRHPIRQFVIRGRSYFADPMWPREA